MLMGFSYLTYSYIERNVIAYNRIKKETKSKKNGTTSKKSPAPSNHSVPSDFEDQFL